MAALKKPAKRKDTTKPGTVLIIFLVLFIFATIGAGVAAYYGYEGQEKLRKAAADAKSAENAAKTARDYRTGLVYMLGATLGQDLEAEDKDLGVGAFDEILNDTGKYKDAALYKDRLAFNKLFKEVSDDLTFDGNTKKFKETYRVRLKQTQADLKKTEDQLGTTRKALKDSEAQYTAYQAKLEDYFKTARDQIGKGNAAALDASQKKFEAFHTLVKQNKEIQDEKLELENKLKATEDKLSIEIARLNKMLEEKKNPNVEMVATKRENGDRHALMLDISRGLPLWDKPVGKVTRVDLEKRQVFINIGSALGARPEITFNIFADDGKGNPDKFLKGTLEIIRVIDTQTSLCRITSLYDASGLEIALGDQARGRTTREVEAGIREGDLLFNMFWNTRVAIAGAINFTGLPIDAPSEQMRQLATFAQLLERMGMPVDGYLDLADGQVKGAVTNKTRFLILGDRAEVKNPNDQAQVDRAKMINDAIAGMKKEAMENGLFLISAENFTIAAGYRKPRNANDTELGKFSSTVPHSGNAVVSGLLIQRDGPAASAPAAEKKAAEPKEKKEPEEK